LSQHTDFVLLMENGKVRVYSMQAFLSTMADGS